MPEEAKNAYKNEKEITLLTNTSKFAMEKHSISRTDNRRKIGQILKLHQETEMTLEKLSRENRHLKKDLDNFSGFETEEMKILTNSVEQAYND